MPSGICTAKKRFVGGWGWGPGEGAEGGMATVFWTLLLRCRSNDGLAFYPLSFSVCERGHVFKTCMSSLAVPPLNITAEFLS